MIRTHYSHLNSISFTSNPIHKPCIPYCMIKPSSISLSVSACTHILTTKALINPSTVLIDANDINNDLLRGKFGSTTTDGGSGGGNTGGTGDGSWSGGNNDGSDDDEGHNNHSGNSIGLISMFLNGWRSRVKADPQFPFKVLMEEVVGVTANVAGDMACRPNFGLNELDFVFSTLVVGAIVNFVLMYLLAPTSVSAKAASASSSLLGNFVYKGAQFAVVGFAAGLVGTALTNGLVALRNKMNPSPLDASSTKNPDSPPTLLNAATWALHMGVSANLRYQSVNGLEFVLEKSLPPLGFKACVLVFRCLNNVLGGVTFVQLARFTGSQKSYAKSLSLCLHLHFNLPFLVF